MQMFFFSLDIKYSYLIYKISKNHIHLNFKGYLIQLLILHVIVHVKTRSAKVIGIEVLKAGA